MSKLTALLLLFSCQDTIEFSQENEPSLMYELETISDLFEEQGLTWNPKNLPFTLTFDEMDVWGRHQKTSGYFHITINPDSPDYHITLLHEIGHVNGLEHGQGAIMTYGYLDIMSDKWDQLGQGHLKEYFDLILK